MTVPVVVCGRGGRMATLVGEAVDADQGLVLTARFSTRPEGGKLADVVPAPAVVVDFTTPEATAALLDQALSVPCGLVIGTSGLGDAERALLTEVAQDHAVVVAANFSLSLLSVSRFVRELSAGAGDSWAAGVLDVHFAGKRDRPSGTARWLAGQWGDHAAAEVASFRMGDGVSEHRVLAAGPGEQVEVTHRVADRRAFLPGVLHAIRFVATAPPGRYALADTVREAVS